MSESPSQRSRFHSSDLDVDDCKARKYNRERSAATEYGARPPLESSRSSISRNFTRSRCCGHPSKPLSESTVMEDRGLLERRRVGASSPQREALGRKPVPGRKCYHARDRIETASAALRRTFKHRNRDDINTILRTTQIIAAARRPMTLNELEFAVSTRLQSPYYLRDGIKPDDEVQSDCAAGRDEFVVLCRDLLKRDRNGVIASGMVEFRHKDMRNLISSMEFRRTFGLTHEDEILAAICIRHLGCRGEWDDDPASTSAIRCPITKEEGDCALRDYAVSFWKEHYLRLVGGGQLVHFSLHEAIVSFLSHTGPSETPCQRSCNDVLATSMEMAASHDLPVPGKAYLEMGAEFRQCNHSTHTPLHTAVANSSGEMVRLLLDCGADPNAFANDVRCACSAADAAVSTALALRSLGHSQCHCWRCCSCFSGRTPLHLAASTGQEASLRVLVAGGGDINLSTKQRGDIALHLAAKAGKFRIVQFLLGSGADIGRQNSEGMTALQLAKTGHHYLIAKLLLAAAPPVVSEPAIDAIYVTSGHEQDQSSNPIWRMQTLSLEDRPPKLSISIPQTGRDTVCLAKFDSTDAEVCPNDKRPPMREENWIVVEGPEKVFHEAQ
jgi:ankyrin repeat protein